MNYSSSRPRSLRGKIKEVSLAVINGIHDIGTYSVHSGQGTQCSEQEPENGKFCLISLEPALMGIHAVTRKGELLPSLYTAVYLKHIVVSRMPRLCELAVASRRLRLGEQHEPDELFQRGGERIRSGQQDRTNGIGDKRSSDEYLTLANEAFICALFRPPGS